MTIDPYVLHAIQQERTRQDAKWGGQDHDALMWFLILAEEVAEVGHLIPIPADRVHASILDLVCGGGMAAKAESNQLTDDWQPGIRVELGGPVADPVLLRAELVQLAAVALAMIESLDRQAVTGPDWRVLITADVQAELERMAAEDGTTPEQVLEEALTLAREMRQWRAEK